MSYQAHITGYSLNDDSLPTLDSIKINYPHKVITNTITIEKPIIEKQKKKWITIQPQVTSGFDIINKQWGITAGIGFGINL